MAAAQDLLNNQQRELAAEQQAFAEERSRLVANFKANAQQRLAELEVGFHSLRRL